MKRFTLFVQCELAHKWVGYYVNSLTGVKIQGWMPGQFVSDLILFVLHEVECHVSCFVPRRFITYIFFYVEQTNRVVTNDDFQSQKSSHALF